MPSIVPVVAIITIVLPVVVVATILRGAQHKKEQIQKRTIKIMNIQNQQRHQHRICHRHRHLYLKRQRQRKSVPKQQQKDFVK